jgi:cell pole-organizing protein PopZ
MEEILASIRRIISEDDAPAETAEPEAHAAPEPAAPPPPAPEPELEPIAFAPEPPPPEPAPAPIAAHEPEDVLELTDRVREPAETHGDVDVYAPEPPRSEPPRPEPAWHAPIAEEEPLIAAHAADSAAFAFGRLAQTVSMPAGGRSLEDVVRELLRPMLKAWLDEHLPEIVQARVDAEVERISRTRGR